MHEASLTLPAEMQSVGQARRFLREVLAEWHADGYDLAAPQVLTELATNAALHARSEYIVHLRLEPDWLLVEVTDSSSARPLQRNYGSGATTGRGIALVEALSQAWGVEASPTGKTVWCRVATDDRLPDYDDADPMTTEVDDNVTPFAVPRAAGQPHPGRTLARAA